MSSQDGPDGPTVEDTTAFPSCEQLADLQFTKATQATIKSIEQAIDRIKRVPDPRSLVMGKPDRIVAIGRQLGEVDLLARRVSQFTDAQDRVNRRLAALNREASARLARLEAAAVMPGFQMFVAACFELRSEIEEIEASDFPFKWADSLPGLLVRRMYQHWRDGDPSAMYELLTVTLIDADVADEMARECRECATAACHADIIGDALWAHQEGRYSLSVPVLMAQTEGMLRRTAVAMGAMETVEGTGGYWRIVRVIGEMERQAQRIVDEADDDATRRRAARFVAPLFGPFVEFLRKQYFPERRNPIMHGNTVDYGTVELSAECVLALNEALEAAMSVQEWLDAPDEQETT